MVAARVWFAAALALGASLSRAGELVVAFPLSLQPYFLPFQQSGLAYDTIRAAFAARGYAVRPLFVSSRQIGNLIKSDSSADCVPVVSPGSEHGWSTTRKIGLLHDFAVTRPGVEVAGLEDLKRLRVLGYSGALWYLGERFRSEMEQNPYYREIGNHRAQVRLLLQAAVDVIVGDRLLISWYLDYLKGEGVTDTEVVFHDLFDPVAHEFLCRSPEIAEEFSLGLAQILKDGTLQNTLANYGELETNRILSSLREESPGSGRSAESSEAADTPQ